MYWALIRLPANINGPLDRKLKKPMSTVKPQDPFRWVPKVGQKNKVHQGTGRVISILNINDPTQKSPLKSFGSRLGHDSYKPQRMSDCGGTKAEGADGVPGGLARSTEEVFGRPLAGSCVADACEGNSVYYAGNVPSSPSKMGMVIGQSLPEVAEGQKECVGEVLRGESLVQIQDDGVCAHSLEVTMVAKSLQDHVDGMSIEGGWPLGYFSGQ